MSVAIEGPVDTIDADVVDNGDGTYGVTYAAATGGTYELMITLRGDAIKAMPVALQVNTVAGACTASGPGVEGGDLTAPAAFVIVANDPTGACMGRGGENFAVVVTAPDGTTQETPVNDNG
jgi:hypothetical protein